MLMQLAEFLGKPVHLQMVAAHGGGSRWRSHRRRDRRIEDRLLRSQVRDEMVAQELADGGQLVIKLLRVALTEPFRERTQPLHLRPQALMLVPQRLHHRHQVLLMLSEVMLGEVALDAIRARRTGRLDGVIVRLSKVAPACADLPPVRDRRGDALLVPVGRLSPQSRSTRARSANRWFRWMPCPWSGWTPCPARRP